jgi:hypothetical protein
MTLITKSETASKQRQSNEIPQQHQNKVNQIRFQTFLAFSRAHTQFIKQLEKERKKKKKSKKNSYGK